MEINKKHFVVLGSIAEKVAHNKYNWKVITMEMSGAPGSGKTAFMKAMGEESDKLFEMGRDIQKDFGDVKLLVQRTPQSYMEKIPYAEIIEPKALPEHILSD